jgi:hypothetical protein
METVDIKESAAVLETVKMCAARTTLKSMGEFGYLGRVYGCCLQRPAGVLVGIGDDDAFKTQVGRLARLATDMLVEGVHFHRHLTSGEDLGHKALPDGYRRDHGHGRHCRAGDRRR